MCEDFGVQFDSCNLLGYKDMISNLVIEGSGIKLFFGQGLVIKFGEFVLGYFGEVGVFLGMFKFEVLGKNGIFVVLCKYYINVGSFNCYFKENVEYIGGDVEFLVVKLVGCWCSGVFLMLVFKEDDFELGYDFNCNNDFIYKNDLEGLEVLLGLYICCMNLCDIKLELFIDVNIYWIICCVMVYGFVYDFKVDSLVEDKVECGLYFIFISVKVMDIIEFL